MRLQQETKNHEAKLTIGIPFELHSIIKAHATLNNSSIKDYVLDALKGKLQHETKLGKISSTSVTKTKIKLQQVVNKKVAKILADADAGKVAKKTFKDVGSTMKYLLK